MEQAWVQKVLSEAMAHQRRVTRVSEMFVEHRCSDGTPVPAAAGCCAAKVLWTVC